MAGDVFSHQHTALFTGSPFIVTVMSMSPHEVIVSAWPKVWLGVFPPGANSSGHQADPGGKAAGLVVESGPGKLEIGSCCGADGGGVQ